RARTQLGYVPEAADPPGHLTGAELFDLIRALKRAPPVPAALIDQLAVGPLVAARIERLSLGERRRVCLAAALIGDPRVLILDEPTNGLDVAGVPVLGQVLRDRAEAGAAVLLATHDHAFAERLADVRLRLGGGRLDRPRADGATE
ncbi:MAG: ATP-binding cassette domain-containing protein, partial [Myxococcota bacterium]